MRKIFNKKNILLFLSFFIPIIMIYLYILFQEIITEHNYFMNGENFLVADMRVQYISLYNYIHNVLHGTDSIFYSFHNGLGSNMASTIGYYLASPFNVLYGFVKKIDIPIIISIIYSLKIALCSLFMNIYISHKFGYKYTNIIFSLSYAFMGFTTVYYFNSMWLDVIYMTPLVIMGIDKLIDGKPLQYIITLCLSIIFNFYISFMLCIFCVMYFIYELFIRYSIKDFKSYKRIILRFIISSLLAGGLSAFFLVPVILNLQDMLRFPLEKSKLTINYNFFDKFIYKIVSNIYPANNNKADIILRERPIIYVYSLNLILCSFYFFNEKKKKKEKLLSLSVILIFILSFMIPYLEYIWQGFSFPNGYIDRFSYLYCFFIVLLAAKQFYSNEKISLIKYTLFTIIYIFISLMIIRKNYDFLNLNDIFIYDCFIVINIIIYYIKYKLNIKKIINFLIIVVFITEIIITYSMSKITRETYNDKLDYRTYYNELCPKLNNLDNNFYRVGEFLKFNNMGNYICNFYSTTTETSTNNKKMYKFIHKNGGRVSYIAIKYDYGKLPILDSILGVKYSVGDELDNEMYDLYGKYNVSYQLSPDGKAYIYRNPYSLSLGYSISDSFDDNYKSESGTRLDNLNNLFKSLSGINEDIFTKISYNKIDDAKIYNLEKKQNDLYMIYDYKMSTNYSVHGSIFINNQEMLLTDDNNGLIHYILPSDINKMYSKINNNVDIKSYDFYYFNRKAFTNGINKLKNHQLYNIKVDGNKLSAEIDLDKDSIVMITIPYDKGWHVYVDGKKVKYREIADTFIGINIPKGKHKITMRFYPRGLILGIGITSLNILLVVLYLKKLKD